MVGYLSVDLLPASVTTADLRQMLAGCEGVRRCRVARRQDGESLGFALIETATTGDAERILQALDGTPIRGQGIRVSRLDAPAGV